MLKERFRKFLPVVVDLETGGFNSKNNAILEIAIQLIDEKIQS
jgi:ribonuclease T